MKIRGNILLQVVIVDSKLIYALTSCILHLCSQQSTLKSFIEVLLNFFFDCVSDLICAIFGKFRQLLEPVIVLDLEPLTGHHHISCFLVEIIQAFRVIGERCPLYRVSRVHNLI